MKIVGFGHVLPEPRFLVDVDHPKPMQLEAIRRAGYEKYRVSKESARDMGAKAVIAALMESGHTLENVGFVVAGQSDVPDFIGIDLACQVSAELGGLEVRTVNLVEGCGSGISTWSSANRLVEDLEEGQVGVVVVVQRVSEAHHDRFGAMNGILSDGAAAAVVTRNDAPSADSGFVFVGGYEISDSRFVDMMRIERGGGQYPVLLPGHDSREDQGGRERLMELYGFTGDELAEFLELRSNNVVRVVESAMDEAGWAMDDHVMLLHTLEGRQSIEGIAARLGVDVGRTNAALVAEIGHAGCVDPLMSLDLMKKQGEIRPGDRVVMSVISTGMKWGCCLLEYRKGADRP
ncbi:3-oxoacyl-[acyl-carrier-protein] synthase III C-terminal domain-containing protein [Kocuria atrinae]|uniref:3-oxoacyl-[acyl-carrier-protein] synthase III C-terminal domain-containing protein n=1 Tax=Kocuria atrinae TaxID=592377 RepID=UPI00037DF647|nr:3-oxoacyl-[acyl-carrier-protein] synthase III C-terminal domain-containing protein [Kocuria atrinae]